MADERLTRWQHPVTGEHVTLEFGSGQTRLTRGGRTEVQGPPEWDEAAERRRYAEGQADETLPIWLLHWADRFAARHGEAQARAKVLETGLSAAQWDGLRNLRPSPGGSGLPPEFHSRLAIDEGSPEAALFDIPAPLRLPLAEMMVADLHFAPPSADTVFGQHMQELRAEGFVRLTARRPDGALWLPAVLEPHRPALEASERPLLRLAADPARAPQPWESRVGGVPYRPLGAPWPLSRGEGGEVPRPLVFLAQLNLAEVNPGGVAVPDLPAQGLLQFFILNGDLYGAEFGEGWAAQDRFRVLYFPEVIRDAGALEPEGAAPLPDSSGDDPEDGLPLWGTEAGPLRRAVALAAVPDREPVSGADDHASALLGTDIWEDPPEGEPLAAALYGLAPGGHKLGGSPDFTQSDPRAPGDDWALLLQLDSDEALGLMWGDVGTANFFIRPADLRARDFSRVAYHWDCG